LNGAKDLRAKREGTAGKMVVTQVWNPKKEGRGGEEQQEGKSRTWDELPYPGGGHSTQY